MARFVYGSKPTGNPSGAGYTNSGVIRGTTRAGRAKAWWLLRLGGRVGDKVQGGPNPNVAFLAYEANKTTWRPEDKLAETAPITITTFGDASWGGATGANVEATVLTPILIPAGMPVTLAAYGEGGDWSAGQDLSGATMHQRTGLTDPPDPFGGPPGTPQGNMALWGIGYDTTAPTIPLETLIPPSGGFTTDTTPTVGVDFRSTEEELEGFTFGELDELTNYQIQLWNGAGTVKVDDSGFVTASPTEQSNRRASWTTSVTLSNGLAIAKARVWNKAGEPSDWHVWSFSVNASSVDVAIAAADIAIASPLRTTSPTPGVTITWHHGSGTAGTQQQFRIRQQDTDTIVRAAGTYVNAIANNATETITGATLFAGLSWTALPRGKVYRYEVQGFDGTTWSGWNPGPWFIVNAAPNVPVALDPPAGKAFTSDSYPILRAVFSDNDDDPSILLPVWFVRSGGSGSGAQVTDTRTYQGNGVWAIPTDSGDFPAVGAYEWRCVATDAAGTAGTYSAWTAITRVTPVNIVWTLPVPPASPTDPTAVIATATPSLGWTVDRTQVSFRARVYQISFVDWFIGVLGEVLGGETFVRPPVLIDSDVVASSVGSWAIPSGKLRNLLDYTIVNQVTTSDGLTSETLSGFRLEYDPRPAVTNFTATAVSAAFDLDSTPSRILLSHDPVPASAGAPGTPWASDAEFGGYEYRRRDLATDEVETLGENRARATTTWWDDTALGGHVYEYSAAYTVRQDLDQVTSDPALDQAAVVIGGVVMDVVAGGEGRVALRYFAKAPQVAPQRDRVVRKSWSAKPRITAGATDYRRWRATARVFQEQGATFTPTDLIAAADDLGRGYRDAAGQLVPKVVCLRDDLGDLGYYSVLSVQWERNTFGNVHEVDFDLIEVAWTPATT
jgi:hypothetical protein